MLNDSNFKKLVKFNSIIIMTLTKIYFSTSLKQDPAVVAWIVKALLSHSVEEYVLAIGGSNPALGINKVANAPAVYVCWNCIMYICKL